MSAGLGPRGILTGIDREPDLGTRLRRGKPLGILGGMCGGPRCPPPSSSSDDGGSPPGGPEGAALPRMGAEGRPALWERD